MTGRLTASQADDQRPLGTGDHQRWYGGDHGLCELVDQMVARVRLAVHHQRCVSALFKYRHGTIHILLVEEYLHVPQGVQILFVNRSIPGTLTEHTRGEGGQVPGRQEVDTSEKNSATGKRRLKRPARDLRIE